MARGEAGEAAMSDLIERLLWLGGIGAEAATELDRLRRELAEARELVADGTRCYRN
jgi:hypothetical protein